MLQVWTFLSWTHSTGFGEGTISFFFWFGPVMSWRHHWTEPRWEVLFLSNDVFSWFVHISVWMSLCYSHCEKSCCAMLKCLEQSLRVWAYFSVLILFAGPPGVLWFRPNHSRCELDRLYKTVLWGAAGTCGPVGTALKWIALLTCEKPRWQDNFKTLTSCLSSTGDNCVWVELQLMLGKNLAGLTPKCLTLELQLW